MTMRFVLALIFAGWTMPVAAALQLAPVLGNLEAPVFLTNAGDGSNRLFVVEQAGIVRVAQPAATDASVFLDIRAKVAAGGERGLLGLAFHPDYASNGRFFVYYTRNADGAIVVAEYRVSANPNAAGPAETPLLTIAHPDAANHNGGMLAFGRDGYLYIGVGDGGAGNDPPGNAQNVDVLLGKILRIDVDRADAQSGTPYATPADNPFVNARGRDEIFAYGLRNPWRFSFDLVTGVLWAGDVGQSLREEVNMPVVRGGNYGWRVYEGFACSGNDPALCDAANYRFPILDYGHDGGRCSITGGYVYRGNQRTLDGGTYVFADFCSGEIFGWNGARVDTLLDTALNVASFGEDESGELYVVDLGGTVSRLTNPSPCAVTLAPVEAAFDKAGGAGEIAVVAPPGCGWSTATADAWLTVGDTNGSGVGTVSYRVAPFVGGTAKRRTGTITVGGSTFTVTQNRLRILVRGGR